MQTAPQAHSPTDTPAEAPELSVDIPAMPHVAAKATELVKDPNTTNPQIARVLSGDQALCAEILKVVNSALYGLPQKVATVDRALAMLGMREVERLMFAASVKSFFADNDTIDIAMWEHGIAVGVGTRIIAEECRMPLRGSAFTCGMMHDIGHAVINLNYRGAFAEVFDEVKRSGANFAQVERQRLQFDHLDVGAALADSWQLPAELAASVHSHHDPMGAEMEDVSDEIRGIVGAVAMSDWICRRLELGRPDFVLSEENPEADAQIYAALEATGVEEARVSELSEEIKAAFLEERDSLS